MIVKLSTLLAVPDNPKEPILYLLRGLMSVDLSSSTIKLKYLALLSAYVQESYPYTFHSGSSTMSF